MSSYQNRLRSVFFFGIVLMLLKLLVTGDIQYFISPKMEKFTIFALITCIIIGLIHLLELFSEKNESCNCSSQRKNNSISLAILISIPIITSCLFSTNVLGSSVASKRGISSSENIVKQQAKTININRSSSKSIEVDDDMYGHIILDVQNSVDEYVGKKISFNGFVYRDKQTKINQVYVSRFALTCCVADAQVFGLMVEGKEVRSFKNDQWVNVSGTIEKIKVGKFYKPIIHLDKIKNIKPLRDPYVYFD
jgi:putative membrane protein